MASRLVAVVGPTASGKTDLSIFLARQFNTEIVSADSRQIFKELTIGVASPSIEQLASVKHHHIASHSILQEMNAGIYETLAIESLNKIFTKNDIAFLVGGSGLYVHAVCHGFDELPPTDSIIRKKLNDEFEEHGLTLLLTELEFADPEYFSQVDKNNPHRVIRSLEVIRTSGMKFSSFRKKTATPRNFSITKIGIDIPREELYERINNRVDKMMEDGLLNEVKNLFDHRKLMALNTVGYKELFDHFEGNISLEKAIEKIKQNSRNFAKRQLTWFKADKEIKWFDGTKKTEILDFLIA